MRIRGYYANIVPTRRSNFYIYQTAPTSLKPLLILRCDKSRPKSMDCRFFMDDDKRRKYAGSDHMYTGAIFMSNSETKKECIERNLFGLPASQTGFMKRVKAGMLLFLFEHEERKLYGVFEATSDGALNIVPNAFTSSGRSFPAQILFKRVWMCKPLTEDEFYDAIKENYYMPHKFRFGLSYKQVYNLVHLFSLKRICLEQYQKPGIRPNKIIRAFEKSGFGKLREPDKGSTRRFRTDVNNKDDDIDSSRGCFYRSKNQSVHSNRHEQTLQNSIVDTEHGSSFEVSLGTQPRANLTHPTFQNDWVRRISPIDQYYVARDYHMIQGSRDSVGLDVYPSAQEHTANMRSRVDSMDPSFSRKVHPSHADFKCNLPSNNDQSPDVSRSHGIYTESLCHTMSSHVSLPYRAFNSHGNLRDFKETFPDCPRPCPTSPLLTPGFTTNKATISPSADIPKNSHSCTKLSDQEEICRGQQHLGLSSALYIPLCAEDALVEKIEPTYLPNTKSKEELDAQYTCNLESEEKKEDLNPNQTKHDEYYAISANSKFHADTEQKRTSVFSRLARASEHSCKYEVGCKLERNLSFDQFSGMRSETRDQWSMNTDIELMRLVHDGNKQLLSTTETEQGEVTAVFQSCSETITEERSSLPLLNFKRKNKMEYGTEKNGSVGEDECKYKRRRLVRPSFSKGCQNVDSSSQEFARPQLIFEHGVAKSANSIPLKTVTAENIVLPELKSNSSESGSATSLYVEQGSFSEECQNVDSSYQEIARPQLIFEHGTAKSPYNIPLKTETAENIVSPEQKNNSSEAGSATPQNVQGSKSCGSASWLFLKSIVAEAKVSGGNPKGIEQNASNAPRAVSRCEASLLPVLCESRDHLESSVGKIDTELVDFLPLEVGED